MVLATIGTSAPTHCASRASISSVASRLKVVRTMRCAGTPSRSSTRMPRPARARHHAGVGVERRPEHGLLLRGPAEPPPVDAHERVEADALGDLGRVECVAKVGVVGQVPKEERRATAARAREHRLKDAAHRRHVRAGGAFP